MEKETAGPLAVVRKEMEKLMAQLPSGTVMRRMAVTGSGREYIAGQIGTDMAVNEITELSWESKSHNWAFPWRLSARALFMSLSRTIIA